MTQTLPLPNPGDWVTTEGAAWLLGVSRRTVERMAAAGTLTAYRPGAGPIERPPAMFWLPEVARVKEARLLVAGATR